MYGTHRALRLVSFLPQRRGCLYEQHYKHIRKSSADTGTPAGTTKHFLEGSSVIVTTVLPHPCQEDVGTVTSKEGACIFNVESENITVRSTNSQSDPKHELRHLNGHRQPEVWKQFLREYSHKHTEAYNLQTFMS